jgi:hypothetical protein
MDVVYSTTIVVSFGGSIAFRRVNGIQFVFPRMRESEWEKGHTAAVKPAQGWTQQHFFPWGKHPAFHVA